jgi:hypothetical protein
MEGIPHDVAINIALNLDIEKLHPLCLTNSQFHQVCKDPYFWKLKVMHDGYPWIPEIKTISDYEDLLYIDRGITMIDEFDNMIIRIYPTKLPLAAFLPTSNQTLQIDFIVISQFKNEYTVRLFQHVTPHIIKMDRDELLIQLYLWMHNGLFNELEF